MGNDMYKEYKVIKDDSLYSLEKEVEKSLEYGWTCQGGVSTYTIFGEAYYCQAMVR